jgi:hypothetical protein
MKRLLRVLDGEALDVPPVWLIFAIHRNWQKR